MLLRHREWLKRITGLGSQVDDHSRDSDKRQGCHLESDVASQRVSCP
jgi:hypothetical protein